MDGSPTKLRERVSSRSSTPPLQLSAALIGLLGSSLAVAACSAVSQGNAPNTSSGGMTHSGGIATSTGGVSTGSGGVSAQGGAPSTGGSVNGGGSGMSGTGGATGSGGISNGGASASGGTANTGGAMSSGGSKATGGATNPGGTTSSGGSKATGGMSASGGQKSSGGAPGTGGGSASGGSTSTGGASTAGPDQCKPIGFATRTGRSGSAFTVTGGGSLAPVVVKTFADLKTYAADGQARVIHIDGTLGSGWSGNTGDRLEIKSNKTIVGLRPGTQLKAPIHINGASNVIVRNIVIRGPGSNEDQAWDNINIEGSSKNIWIDHCEFWDGQDGNADVVKGADTVTFTWNIFGYSLPGHSHNLSNLIASSDDEPESDGKLDITYMFNWWKAAAERQPRCRYGYVHVLNNLYTADAAVGASNLGVTNGFSCNVLTENNHFVGQKAPIDLGKQAGAGSVQQAAGNLFENCTGNEKGSGTAFTPPYEYKSFMVPAAQVKALVQKSAGATLASPTACN